MSLGGFLMAMRPFLNTLSSTGQKLFSPRYLLYTNTVVTTGLSITGDILQQWYQASTKWKMVAWDRTRTRNVAVTGMLIAPLVHFWYIFLDRRFPGRSVRTLAKKVALDQIAFSPLYLSLFMLTLCTMEGKNWTQIKLDLVDKGSLLYLAEWVVWPPAQVINFYFLPSRYRVLYDNTVSLSFDCFWSYVWYDSDLGANLSMRAARGGAVEGESKTQGEGSDKKLELERTEFVQTKTETSHCQNECGVELTPAKDKQDAVLISTECKQTDAATQNKLNHTGVANTKIS